MPIIAIACRSMIITSIMYMPYAFKIVWDWIIRILYILFTQCHNIQSVYIESTYSHSNYWRRRIVLSCMICDQFDDLSKSHASSLSVVCENGFAAFALNRPHSLCGKLARLNSTISISSGNRTHEYRLEASIEARRLT